MRLAHCIALLLAYLITADTVAAFFCPTGCNCFQRTVRCMRARLTAIPRLPNDATVLDLRFNHFQEIPSNAFNGLSQVSTLFLNENGIAFIQDGAFDGLTGLRFLYLSNNRISGLSANLFKNLKNLEAIFLENNDIWQLDVNTFANLPRLNRLFLFNNKITNIPADIFNNMPSLKRLRLDGNPIECNCGVYSLWRQYYRQVQKQHVMINLKCEMPTHIQGYDFGRLHEQHFHCKKPEIIRAPHDMRLATGHDVELPCEMTGDPEPEILWMQNTNQISSEHSNKMQIMPGGSLKIYSLDENDVGIYECIGRNELGTTKSQPIRLNVDYEVVESQNHIREEERAPKFTQAPSDKIAALDRDAVRIDCGVSGLPQPEIRWFFNGRMIEQSTEKIRLQSNGSLVIVQPTLLSAGVYRCQATNQFGSIEASARVDVREFPEILIAPQDQTIMLDKPLVLECDADGNPVPEISWQFNGQKIALENRIQLENENTELIINAAQLTDSGIYTCIAENENGKSTATAKIVVEQRRTKPQIVIAPADMESITGTTIELPCRPDALEGVEVTWRKDGSIVDTKLRPFKRYHISDSKSLFVKNATIVDGGRFECSLKNEFGRVHASAFVTIKNDFDLAPGDRFVRIAFTEAAREIDMAINNTIDTLFTNRNRTLPNGSPAPINYADLLRVFRFPTGEARQLARAAEIYERTLVNIRKHVQKGDNLNVGSEKYEFRDLLSREHLRLVAQLSGCMEHREMPNCTEMCFHSKYRSIDGTCNNLLHPTWGASLTAFRRIAMPIYENGFSMPIGWTKNKLYAGFPKPSSRLISTTLISTKEITPDDTITHMVMQWGQFLDHDLDHAIPSVSSESWDGVDCKKTCEFAPPCYPIEVPPNDPRVKNRRCIDVVRSSSICGSGMTSVFFDSVQHREQINQLTSYIDASQVYGFSLEFAQELRNLQSDDGLLRVGARFPNQKDMLPFAAPQDGMDCRRNLDENTMNCFTAGDIRVNEQVGLLAMHTIWMREHNRIATKLRDINPHWDGDTIYHEARKIVGAQMQHITYKQWLPLIVGENGMRKLGEYRGYEPNVNPTIANEFATAALRFGHTIINPILHRFNESYEPIPQGHLQLHKAFFAPWRLAYEGGVDPLMRGMIAAAAKLKKPDQNLNTELTEKLFQTAHAVALDLAAINIQRGRDHGIPGYNVYRKFCNLSVAMDFEDLSGEISSAEIRRKLKELYGHPDNIDVWVGGVLEDQIDGGKVGPLFQCLLIEQFRRLRDGDRFYYENPAVFLPEQLQQIKQASLGRVLCDNGDKLQEMTENVFVLPSRQGGFKSCEDIDGINLYFWQECGNCNSLPPLFNTFVPQTYVKHKRSRRAIANAATVQTDNELEALYDVNAERVSGLEDLISSFEKELKKMHKKIRKLEASCSSQVEHTHTEENAEKSTKHQCIDKNNVTHSNKEVWSPDKCTQCECRHGKINCTHEQCSTIVCENNSKVVTSNKSCCPYCATESN